MSKIKDIEIFEIYTNKMFDVDESNMIKRVNDWLDKNTSVVTSNNVKPQETKQKINYRTRRDILINGSKPIEEYDGSTSELVNIKHLLGVSDDKIKMTSDIYMRTDIGYLTKLVRTNTIYRKKGKVDGWYNFYIDSKTCEFWNKC